MISEFEHQMRFMLHKEYERRLEKATDSIEQEFWSAMLESNYVKLPYKIYSKRIKESKGFMDENSGAIVIKKPILFRTTIKSLHPSRLPTRAGYRNVTIGVPPSPIECYMPE